ncbi:MAG: YbbR-like domain-containing protein [Acidobacteria bacterium]|nr:YbbR-like domain-containing protein [Acidobacteriota bacterium]
MNWLRSCFTENVGLKLLSLALAVVIWSALGGNPLTEATLHVPVEFSNVPDGSELLSAMPEVQLRVRGPGWAVKRVTPGDFSVRVELPPDPETGERTYTFRTDTIQTPTFVKVVQIIPTQVRFTLESTLTKQVPIQPQFAGEAPSNQRVRSFRLRPPRVRIAGPGSHVEKIRRVETNPVDLTSLGASQALRTTVSIPDPLVRLLDSPDVEITVELERAD